MKFLEKEAKGITLIALVVTIVVLLILAGVSINLVIGNNGIITKAVEVKEKNKISEDIEIINMAMAVVNMDEYMNQLNEEEDTFLKELKKTDDNAEVDYNNYPEVKVHLNGDDYVIDFETRKIEKYNPYIARIEDVYYESLQQAFDSIPTNNAKMTVHLLKNAAERNLEILEDQNIDLQLNGNKLEIEGCYTNNGTLKVLDGKLEGDGGEWNNIENEGILEFNNVEFSWCIMRNSNSLKIENSEITGRSDYSTIANSGECIILSAKIEGMLSNYENMKIEDSQITPEYMYNEGISNNGTLELCGNTTITVPNVNKRLIYNYDTGILKIKDNVNVSGDKIGIENKGTLEATGGTISSTQYAIENYGTASITSNVVCSPKNYGTITIIQ